MDLRWKSRLKTRLLEYLKEHDRITRTDVESLLGVSASTALRLLRKMVKSGLLLQKGKARDTKYMIAKL